MFSNRIPGEAAPNAWGEALERCRRRGDDLIDLTDANPTRHGLIAADAETLAMLADPAVARYAPEPAGARGAREAVARYHAERGVPVDADDVLLTASTSESYAHLFRLLADPGQRIAAPRPSYPLFEPLARAEGVELVHYRLAADERWRPDLDSVAACLAAGARALLLVQPNHPTGTCLDPPDLAAIERLCAAHGAALVSDEVFGDFPWGVRALPGLLGERAVPTFVLSGLSKVCGLPQLKLGWIALAGPPAARAEGRGGLGWLGDLFLSVGAPVERALPRLLERRHEFQGRMRARIAANLATLDALVARRPELERPPADGGWVALLRLPARRDEEAWSLALLERGVVTHPGHFYDLEPEPHLVITLIAEPARFAEAVERLEALVAER